MRVSALVRELAIGGGLVAAIVGVHATTARVQHERSLEVRTMELRAGLDHTRGELTTLDHELAQLEARQAAVRHKAEHAVSMYVPGVASFMTWRLATIEHQRDALDTEIREHLPRTLAEDCHQLALCE